MIADFSPLNRQRVEQRLRDGLAKDPSYLERQLKREIRKTERARARGMFTPTAKGSK